MAHPDTPEAVDVPVSYDDDDSAAAAISDILGDDDADDTDSNPDQEEGEDLDLDEEEEAGEDEDEPDEPAIVAPASLNAEEKAVFAQLPKEAQQAWSASETRRNAQVQEATTKASEAQRTADARAASADAEAKALYARQLSDFVKAFEPEAPDPQLAYNDPQRYIAQKAQFDALKAQHDELVQQVTGISTEAETATQQAFIAQRDRELMALPEIANPETRKATLDRAMDMASKLGFDPAEIAKDASARDIKAFLTVATAFEKAEKYDAAMNRKMQKVRSAKARNLRPNAAQPEGSGKLRAVQEAKTRLRQTGSLDDAAAALSHLF